MALALCLKLTTVVEEGKKDFAMVDRRTHLFQKIQRESESLVASEKDILNDFLSTKGLSQIDLDESISTERIRTRHTHTTRSGALLTEDRDDKIEEICGSARTVPYLRRRWSVDLYQTPDQRYPHLGNNDGGAVGDAVERDFVLQRHKHSTSELDCDKHMVYLETERAQLRNEHLGEIDHIGVWFYDEVLDIGLDSIYRVLGCEYHDIAILGTPFAAELYTIGRDENATLEAGDALQKTIGTNKFIMIPVSNGWKRIHAGDRSSHLLGTHWTLVIIDCHQPVIQARHYDSDGMSSNLEAAMVLLRGFSRIYAETRPDYKIDQETLDTNLHQEMHCPTQKLHNRCYADGGGACGPFVWAFAKDMVQYIIECHEDAHRLDRHVDFDITLPIGFVQRWCWDSGATRKRIKNLLELERKSRVWRNGTHDWWKTDGKPGWEDWLAARRERITADYFWDPWHGIHA